MWFNNHSDSLNSYCKNVCKIKFWHMATRLMTAMTYNQNSRDNHDCKSRNIDFWNLEKLWTNAIKWNSLCLTVLVVDSALRYSNQFPGKGKNLSLHIKYKIFTVVPRYLVPGSATNTKNDDEYEWNQLIYHVTLVLAWKNFLSVPYPMSVTFSEFLTSSLFSVAIPLFLSQCIKY